MPPSEPQRARGRAPVYGNPFVGRAAELAALEACAAAGERLVSIVGPAGIGKTRLAVEFAAALARDRGAGAPSPVLFVDLADIDDEAGVCRAVGEALGEPVGEGTLRERVARALDARGPCWLVLDGCDQAVRPAATTVGQWLALAPRARFVVTSREPLGLASERLHQLGPLDLPARAGDAEGAAAVRLLTDRVQRLRDGWAPAPDERDELATLVRELDGIPLAIELAAPRVAALGVRAVLARLPWRFDLLARARGDGAARHATLRAALDASWNLLDASEQATLAQLAVFRGGFTLDAAEAVVQVPGPDARPVFDLVQALRDKSLLRAAEGARLGLYSTVRAYAGERLGEAGGARAVEQRHTEYFLALAERLAAAPDARAAAEGLADEWDNLLAVVARALPAQPVLALRVLAALASAAWWRGAPEALLPHLERALQLAPPDAPPAAMAAVLIARGNILRVRGELAQGAQILTHAAELARRGGDARAEAHALHGLGGCHFHRRELAAAETAYQGALAAAQAAGDAHSEGIARFDLGNVAVEHGAFDAGREHYTRGLALLRRARDARFTAETLVGLGVLALQQGRDQEARLYLTEGLATFDDHGWHGLRYPAVATLGVLDQLAGRLDAAAERYATAAASAEAFGARHLAVVYRGYLGLVWLEQGRAREARAQFEPVRAALGQVGDTRHAGLIAGFAAVAAAALGARAEAADRLAELDATLHVASGPSALEARLIRCAVELTLEPASAAAASVARTALEDAASDRGIDVRLAARLLERLVPRHAAHVPRDEPALEVHYLGHWFRLPDGTVVPCRRRRALRRILLHLAEQRERAPGQPVSNEQLLAAGWPGEKILAEAARNRLSVSLVRLRELGLRGLLLTDDDGHRLDPRVPVRVVRDDATDDDDDDVPR